MKKRRGLELFSVSFLDIISCGFGAVVLLVLISDTSETSGETENPHKTRDLLATIQQLDQEISDASGQRSAAEGMRQSSDIIHETYANRLEDLNAAGGGLINQVSKLEARKKGLQSEIEEQKRVAGHRAPKPSVKPVDQVGGIPVDREYVVFLIDSSGSMKRIWPRLLSEIERILKVHPSVKGFQVINDKGNYLFPASAGSMLPDNRMVRDSALASLKTFNAPSDSNPVGGLRRVLKDYRYLRANMAVYILGDEFSGGSFDAVIDELNILNRSHAGGKPLARVHAMAFYTRASEKTFTRYTTLMREITQQNDGTFILLPK